MATLQRIRNRAGLLIAVIIGMAIFAFIIQDFIGSGQPGSGKAQFDLAEIDGQTIQYQEYQERVDRLAEYYRLRMGNTSIDEATMESIREQTWQDIVREYTTSGEYEELGIAVSIDEVMDMIQGRNPHPIIQSIFTDPETGMLNRSFLVQFIRTMNEDPSGQQKTIWLYLESEIIKDRAFNKYNNLIRKGMYITSLEAESNYFESARKVDFSFIVKRYNSVDDSLISFKTADLQDYYKEHQNRYSQDASVDFEYVVFEVNPTPEDDQAASDWIYSMVNEFETVKDVSSLVSLESDVPYDDINYKDGQLSDSINDFMFRADIGDIYGPYFEDNSYRIAKLVEVNYLPDSVRARHILIQPTQTRDYNTASLLADSLKTAIEGGSNFIILAMQFSDDATNVQGGDLGWFAEGAMVKPFNDASFEGEIGEIQLVESQFGFHIIEVMEKGQAVKKVKRAILSRKVEPSSGTYHDIYSRAIEFAGKNNTYKKFNESATGLGLVKRYADLIREDQKTIAGLESPREMIRWAFGAELNEVSGIFEFGNNFVVAALTEIREEGTSPMDQVQAEIELEVRKQMKAEIIIEEFNSILSSESSFENLASQLSLLIQEASQVSFSSVSVQSAGIEPNLIAIASNMAENEISNPVIGNNGVYVLMLNQVATDTTGNYSQEKDRMMLMLQSQANFEAYEALQEAAKIKDNRSKFF